MSLASIVLSWVIIAQIANCIGSASFVKCQIMWVGIAQSGWSLLSMCNTWVVLHRVWDSFMWRFKRKQIGGYLKFIDNCDVLTVVEGEIETEEIVENLLNLFDPKWHWQLRKMDDYMYLVRFLPHKQISATLISDTTYFKLEFWLHWRHGMEM
jgi:hypothetical protein